MVFIKLAVALLSLCTQMSKNHLIILARRQQTGRRQRVIFDSAQLLWVGTSFEKKQQMYFNYQRPVEIPNDCRTNLK